MNTQKPLSMLRADFINSLISLINNSQLPPYIIEPILGDALSEVQRLSKEQLARDRSEYEKSLQQQYEAEDEIIITDEAKED